MFNGLVRDIGSVRSFDTRLLRIVSGLRPHLGDSIAVNGACLSVVALHKDGFSVEVSSESARCLALENFCGQVHLEPAMRFGQGVDGHLMQGHIDALGVIESICPNAVGVDFFVSLDSDSLRFVVPKGSIAVEGVSLTINEVSATGFRLTLIPLTFRDTLFGTFAKGRRVHIETDMFVRSLAHLLKNRMQSMTDIVVKPQLSHSAYLEQLLWSY
ncbi:MAG: riboflavin synthase [Helicobacter sp.]|nr:riboflavin synthase [Helicobacter sp.]